VCGRSAVLEGLTHLEGQPTHVGGGGTRCADATLRCRKLTAWKASHGRGGGGYQVCGGGAVLEGLDNLEG